MSALQFSIDELWRLLVGADSALSLLRHRCSGSIPWGTASAPSEYEMDRLIGRLREMQKQVQSTDECLKKVDSKEPLFVLRARDSLAGDAVRYWAWRLHFQICDGHAEENCPKEKVREARGIAIEMDGWSGRRLPD